MDVKIIGTEKHRHENSTFFLYVVDNLDSIYTIYVKKGFFTNSDSYKKHVFTNGTTEKTFTEKAEKYCKVRFKVIEGDWLIMMDDNNNVSLYISEQYCGPIKVRNKTAQEIVDASYMYCRERLNSKREFAKEMGAISRRLNLPFQVVLAFKGNEELLRQMVRNIQNAINNHLYEDVKFMQALSGDCLEERIKAIEAFGIVKIPDFQSEKIASYLHECLENRKIIRRYE